MARNINYKSNRQRDRADEIRSFQLNEFGFEFAMKKLVIYCKFINSCLRLLNAEEYGNMKPVMDKLMQQNCHLKTFPDADFEAFIHRTWETAIYNIKEFSLALLWSVFGSRSCIAKILNALKTRMLIPATEGSFVDVVLPALKKAICL